MLLKKKTEAKRKIEKKLLNNNKIHVKKEHEVLLDELQSEVRRQYEHEKLFVKEIQTMERKFYHCMAKGLQNVTRAETVTFKEFLGDNVKIENKIEADWLISPCPSTMGSRTCSLESVESFSTISSCTDYPEEPHEEIAKLSVNPHYQVDCSPSITYW